jgi:hypothetical protein
MKNEWSRFTLYRKKSRDTRFTDPSILEEVRWVHHPHSNLLYINQSILYEEVKILSVSKTMTKNGKISFVCCIGYDYVIVCYVAHHLKVYAWRHDGPSLYRTLWHTTSSSSSSIHHHQSSSVIQFFCHNTYYFTVCFLFVVVSYFVTGSLKTDL